MDIILKNNILNGSVHIPSSKSLAHRYLICGALAQKPGSVIKNISMSDDILATIGALSALGAEISVNKDECTVIKCIEKMEYAEIDCGESGSTLRFMLPIALSVCDKVKFNGQGRLLERPLTPYFDIMDKQGILYDLSKDTLSICGSFKEHIFTIPGDISSQFISGLLFTAALSENDTIIDVTGHLQSKDYIDMTIHSLEIFGLKVKRQENKLVVLGGQKLTAKEVAVEGDYSQAAFYLVAGALENENNIGVLGLNKKSLQGDKEIINILKKAGAIVTETENGIKAINKENLKPFVVDAGDIPDLVPILAVLACGINGESKIVNAKRLRLKESDRLYAIANELSVLGAEVEELEDGLIIKGNGTLLGGTVNCHNDHRIAMALVIASTICENDVEIKGAECVSKSYPHFFEHIANLGGKYEHLGQ